MTWLSEETKKMVFLELQGGASVKSLMTKYHISRPTVSTIRNTFTMDEAEEGEESEKSESEGSGETLGDSSPRSEESEGSERFSPALRQNTDYLFFRKINDNQLPSLFESVYWGENYKSFVNFYHKATASSTFGFLAYDNLTRDDRKFFLVVAERPEFKICYGKKTHNCKKGDKVALKDAKKSS